MLEKLHLTDLSIKIGNIQFKNPILTASGTFGYGTEVDLLMDVSKLGGIVTKSITLHPREGNPPPRIVETPSGMLNSIGLTNIGVDQYIEDKIPLYSTIGTHIIMNIAGSTMNEYEEIVRKKKMFPAMYHFFALGLVYGILHNKKSTKNRNNDIIRIDQISLESIRDVIDICYMILNDGRDDRDILNDMLSYADGGIEELYKIYEKNGSFQLPMLIEDSKKIWAEHVKEFNNINTEDL